VPKSKTRTKRPAPLAGIPARVLALSPSDWAPAQRAAWCRHYLDGAAGRPQRDEPRSRGFGPTWPRVAYRRGQQDADISRADVAQSDQRRRDVAAAREAIERRRERETGSRRDELMSRLSMLGGGLDPHADPRIVGMALGALGLGIESLGGRIVPVDRD
jgi:hypothetical protein